MKYQVPYRLPFAFVFIPKVDLTTAVNFAW
jgi:hypothetical protein